MGSQLVLLFVGFVLTTVAGGVLGFFFQRRNADIQYLAHLHEAERSAALGLFEEISTLMDRRLYRMRQLAWHLQRAGDSDGSVNAAMDAYRQIVFDWNDRLNRNLAMTEIYFGTDIREQVHALYGGFAEIGSRLETASRTDGTEARHAEATLNSLSDAIYELNVQMIRRVREGAVGAFLAETAPRAAREARTLPTPPQVEPLD
jgi:hypothetical protein